MADAPGFDPADPRLPERLWRKGLQWLSMGGEHTMVSSQQRKITQVNLVALLGAAIALVTSLAFWSSGNAALVRGGWLHSPFALLYPLVWLLNRRGRPFMAQWVFFLLAMAQILLNIFCVQGTALALHYYLLALAIMTPLIFPAGQWRSGTILFIVNVSLFIYMDLRGVAALPALTLIDLGTQALLREVVVGSCLILFVLLLSVSEYAAAMSEWRLQQLASSDALTGLPNRLALREAFAREVARRKRESGAMSFATADIDFFKRVNDEWGHDAGDRALCHVSSILRAQVRAGELVARTGGEEFGIILLAEPELAERAAERMCRAVEASPFEYDGKKRTITISIGLVHIDLADDERSASRRADAALYDAKHRGRNRVIVAPAEPPVQA
ncbi:MAG: GGDEF domain-containing protein [Rhodoferax sp.]|nr:GGDEF domain-containing protein [Rhodoferax sp.]